MSLFTRGLFKKGHNLTMIGKEFFVWFRFTNREGSAKEAGIDTKERQSGFCDQIFWRKNEHLLLNFLRFLKVNLWMVYCFQLYEITKLKFFFLDLKSTRDLLQGFLLLFYFPVALGSYLRSLSPLSPESRNRRGAFNIVYLQNDMVVWQGGINSDNFFFSWPNNVTYL